MDSFEPIEFDSLNEADVREEIISPLLRKMGYRSGTTNNIIREQSLRYPKVSMGRKKRDKDPLLRGFADYIVEVKGSVRWTIEAKPPQVNIGPDDIGRAYTYANHPEVRAVLLLCVQWENFSGFPNESWSGRSSIVNG